MLSVGKTHKRKNTIPINPEPAEDHGLYNKILPNARVAKLQNRLSNGYLRHREKILLTGIGLLIVCYAIYYAFSLYYSVKWNIAIISITSFVTVWAIYKTLLSCHGENIRNFTESRVLPKISKAWAGLRRPVLLIIALGILIFIVVDCREKPIRLGSGAGLIMFLFFGWIISLYRSKIPWRLIAVAIVMQVIFGLLTLRWSPGYDAVRWIGDQFTTLLKYSDNGAMAAFGPQNQDKPTYMDHMLFMQSMPTVTFFNSLVEILLYYGVLQVVICKFGGLMGFCMGVGPTEAFVAAANVFLGPSTSVITIANFLPDMTRSELHTVLTTGLATVAGGLFGLYAALGVPSSHLICASIMSAPAALAMSKLVYPETGNSKLNTVDKIKFEKSKATNALEAASIGAYASVGVVGSIIANLIAFVAALHFANATLTWLGDRVGIENLTFQLICSYVFIPISLFMGVEWKDAYQVARLVGDKIFLNDLVAYTELGKLISNRRKGIQPAISIRSETISVYALCGFANFGDVGICLGAIGAMVPSRIGDLAKVAMRALIAGNLACFVTACVAGTLYDG